jgi:hypothetical protein
MAGQCCGAETTSLPMPLNTIDGVPAQSVAQS